jgi:membrane-bound ClpP family serine protease
MSWLSLVSVLFIIVGLSLFLYGVNIHNAVIGWTGFCFGIAGILLYVIPFLYVQLRKKESVVDSYKSSL